ncbi:MAG: hypothetical protein QNJ45_14405 [Ardenticatenaceae bacterium]|nr:hypothetical protein [Ardenticatenaceae bacterium]
MNPQNNHSMIGVGFSLGIGIGAAFGIIFDNIALGVSLGAGFGIILGQALSSYRKE